MIINIPTIQNECSSYIYLAKNKPLLKNLPIIGEGFRKIKVRHKKKIVSPVLNELNNVFKHEKDHLANRAIFAYSASVPLDQLDDNTMEPFYIFPINGFKFLYANSIYNTTNAYKETLSSLMETLSGDGVLIFRDLLKYQYVSHDLDHGLTGSNEIIIYNVPYYYAIRKSLIEDYNNLFIEKGNTSD